MVMVAAADTGHAKTRTLLMTTFNFDQLTDLIALLVVAAAHRRRIDLEDKTKVVAYAWGAESLPR